MTPFAELLERLVFTPGRLGKVALLHRYFATTPDPDRGFGLAALTGELAFQAAKPALIRALAESRTDPVLFAWSHDYVGDLAETTALIWPERRTNALPPSLTEVVQTLLSTPKSELPATVAAWLDASDASVRFAILKLITGGLRVGASARLAKIALAELAGGRIAPDEIEELWHGLVPPYAPLFAWLEGRGDRPDPAGAPVFRPPMLAQPLEAPDLAALDPAAYRAEWKWDGIRVQVVSEAGIARLYSRTGDDIAAAFPDLMDAVSFEAAIDGELLVHDAEGGTGTFSDLQQRLNRKTVSLKVMEQYPVFVRCYDILQDGGEDLRPLPFTERRKRLETFLRKTDPARFDLSPLVEFTDWHDVEEKRRHPPHPVVEGVMLKRWTAPYTAGRAKGPWFKWKRDPFTVDAVLMYAQRGHGKRSSYYSDYTFGVWAGEAGREELVPVGKAYFGFTDGELRQIDRYVRDHTVERFGPVRSVRADRESGLVLEVAFEGLARSTRHKSGLAMRFPRVSRLRWDKPPAEADRIEALESLLDA
jgi:DNA ligase 1